MGHRQSVGRRFVDLYLDAPIPAYPVELERRHCVRRAGDRPPSDTRKAHRVPLLFCARWHCAWCGHELKCQRNVSFGRRRFIIAEPPFFPCDCHESRLSGKSTVLTWTFQGGGDS